MSALDTDCLVLGGGPAGSTFAATLLRHAPGAKVTILEQARFPRWQVGESIVPLINAQLHELGLFERVLKAEFVKKIGNVVVWGPSRVPWSPDFLSLGEMQARDSRALDIPGFDYRPLAGSGLPLDQPVVSFNVRRDQFDALLLTRARELGACVLEGTRATRIERSAGGRVESVSFLSDSGKKGEFRPSFVVDACGLGSPLTRGQRFRDPALKHCAIIGYLRGARWKASYRERAPEGERAAVFVLSVARGWIWYIPLENDLISVGLVTDAAELEARPKQTALEELLLAELDAAPELKEVVRGARLCDDILPNRARVRTCQQWSSFVDTPIGPNWVAVGDAAMFVDPIIPSGVGFAMQSGHRAAYSCLTAHSRADVPAERIWEAYAWYVRGEYGAMSQLAHFMYANNRALDSRFWRRPALEPWRLHLPAECTLSACDFFPLPKAFGWRVVAPLLSGIAGGQRGALEQVYENDGLPKDLSGMALEVRAPLELALRSDYPTDGARNGRLRLYRDVVTRERDFYHRLAIEAADIPERLAPLVAALHLHRDVDSLLDAAPELLSARASERPAVEHATHELLRIVARRGFIRVSRSGGTGSAERLARSGARPEV
ncbi:MAG TPA: NAD(P)/FAD-dependent oxidoreductase [Polyangiaceae bacterium]|nr:NAD(P)/FAD-dependent oxidoreductase [Polyangiaceae bacterium]